MGVRWMALQTLDKRLNPHSKIEEFARLNGDSQY